MITDPTERSDVLPYLEVRLRFIRRVNHSGCTSFGGKMLAAVAIFGPESSDRWPARRSRGFTSEIPRVTFRKKKKSFSNMPSCHQLAHPSAHQPRSCFKRRSSCWSWTARAARFNNLFCPSAYITRQSRCLWVCLLGRWGRMFF